MRPIYIHLRYPAESSLIDVTPVAWWRRAGQNLLALLLILVGAPFLLLLGGMFVLMLLGGMSVILATGAWRVWRLRRVRFSDENMR